MMQKGLWLSEPRKGGDNVEERSSAGHRKKLIISN